MSVQHTATEAGPGQGRNSHKNNYCPYTGENDLNDHVFKTHQDNT